MRSLSLAAGLLLLSLSSAHAESPSLFFSPEEVRRIDDEVAKAPPEQAAQAKHLVHLGSILYFGVGRWTVWLQGERWTPSTDRPNLHIRDVGPDSVRLSVSLPGTNETKDVTLHPRQSLNLLTGDVKEGY